MTRRLARALTIGLVVAALVVFEPPANAVKPSGTIRLVNATQPVLKGDTITVAGRFKHAAKRVYVIQKTRPATTAWRTVKGSRDRLTRLGNYRATVTATATFKYRALLPATKTQPMRVSQVVKITAVTGWRQVSAGRDHTCAIWSNRTLWCWGSNYYGQLGNGTNSGVSVPNTTPSKLTIGGADQTWLAVAAGGYHTCAIRTDHTLWCWGSNHYGQIARDAGSGTIDPNPTPEQVLLAGGGQTWLAVDGGEDHTCAIRSNRTLWCWGWNSFGELGNATNTGSFDPNPTPAQVFTTGADQTWLAVDAGESQTCGIRPDSTLWCWGRNYYGQIGSDVNTNGAPNPSPIQVIAAGDPQTWRSVETGGDHSCGIRTDNTLWCWGRNYYGQVGNDTNIGTGNANTSPAQVVVSGDDQTWHEVRVGGDHGCAFRSDDTLWCWGSNWYGELGSATNSGTGTPNPTPAQVFMSAAFQNWEAVTSGDHHTCGIRPNHTLWCWGWNYFGQLANATHTVSNDPTATPTKVSR